MLQHWGVQVAQSKLAATHKERVPEQLLAPRHPAPSVMAPVGAALPALPGWKEIVPTTATALVAAAPETRVSAATIPVAKQLERVLYTVNPTQSLLSCMGKGTSG